MKWRGEAVRYLSVLIEWWEFVGTLGVQVVTEETVMYSVRISWNQY